MIEIDIRKKLHGSMGDMELHIDLDIDEFEFVAVGGESGSGKTTLLRVLAGLESCSGDIVVHGEVWQSAQKRVPTQHREIGFVFQEYALFANMSVEQNLLYVTRDKKMADKLLEMSGLSQLKDRLPHTLSGGQQQRVSLCRAFMGSPKLLLMDEPLSALDPTMRDRLQHDISRLHREFGTTTIMVSHDPSEIYRLASRMLLMDQGEIIKDATPKEILLQSDGSQKFSFKGEILEILRADIIYIAIVSIGQQIVEVVIDEAESRELNVGDSVTISTKAFAPSISKI
ncbi:Molybdenum transport ATP-binding protein ModC (TC 3.A.1.8.1) [hydrothermal vent metagenome]|uniref:Molybdenum transport ATP-binding protein ModC (TC 3.A.1.8.1) n=1 Tax=hydrothermal vent metagenome TaxID=652676 RepID=A0A1W1B940_9ZZZZ